MPSSLLLDHFQSPRNVGELGPPAIRVDVVNPVCGDMLRLSVRVEDNRVVDVAFKAKGCTASIAAGSALTELLRGRTRTEVTSITSNVVAEAVGGLEPASEHAAQLCVDAVKAFLTKWR